MPACRIPEKNRGGFPPGPAMDYFRSVMAQNPIPEYPPEESAPPSLGARRFAMLRKRIVNFDFVFSSSGSATLNCLRW